uniref:BTB domain-containing protein n=1 Tax=Megaselia scalaris TaxID=36166 RepID=T1GK36_MEGSC
MMDYMYRGEVNISQDQLAALLKAAESLQIKGLSDNRGGAGSGGVGAASGGKAGEPQKHSTGHVPGKLTNIGHIGAGYTLEQHKRARIGPSSIDSQDIGGSREGSSSPTSRRRKKIRRRSVDQVMGDNHENSNSSQNMQINSSVTGPGAITTSIVPSGAVAQAASGNQIQTQTNKKTDILSKLDQGVSVSTINPASATAAPVGSAAGSGTVSEHEHEHDEGSSNKKEHHHNLQSAIKKDKEVGGGGVASSAASSSDIVIEPKSEYDDGNEETVEDLTLDDEIALDELDQTAGPSHGGEGSSQGYAQWQVDRSHDESYMAQDVQQRDPQ